MSSDAPPPSQGPEDGEHLEPQQALARILEQMNSGVPTDILRQELMQLISVEATYHGPIPPPRMIEDYARVYPDAPRIIFQSFERQSMHRQDMEKTLLHGSERRASVGQYLGTGLILIVIAGGLVVTFSGQVAGGTGIIALAMVTGILSYVFGDYVPGRRKGGDS